MSSSGARMKRNRRTRARIGEAESRCDDGHWRLVGAAKVRRPNSGVCQAYGGLYETQAAVDISRKVAQEFRDSRHGRHK
jgi:hypothetical protein